MCTNQVAKNYDHKSINAEQTLAYDNTTNAIISQILYSLSILPVVPPTVFIQIDNFPGNKSYLFFATFGYLLKRQTAIREFYISFMMPGHTHLDVDARFGNFSSYLNAKECGSPQELITAFLECIPGQAQMKQSIYNFKEVLTPYCKNYGKLKQLYDFHVYLDGNNQTMVENARFEVSERLLCGSRQNEDSFVFPIFKTEPPIDLIFQLVEPKLEGIEKMMLNVPKWEKVITATAKTELLQLYNDIKSHVGIPFSTLLQTIQDKAAHLETNNEDETISSENTTTLTTSLSDAQGTVEACHEAITEPVTASIVLTNNQQTSLIQAEANLPIPSSKPSIKSARLNSAASAATTTKVSRKRKAKD